MFLRLSNFLLNHSKFFAFLLGGIAVQTLPPFYHWYLLFICFTSLLWFLHKTQTKKQSFAIGYWFGFSYFAFGLSWVNNALLVNPSETGWVIPISFLASGAFFGIFIGIPCLLTKIYKSLTAQYLAFAAWIVIFEWIRSWFLTGFPWNLLGSSLAFDITLLQSASVWGTYGLSLCIILIASAPVFWIIRPSILNAIISLSTISLFIAGLYGFGLFRINQLHNEKNSDITIRLVQPSIPQFIKWSPDLKQQHFQKYIDLSKTKSLKDIQMVIWGETASPYALDLEKEAMKQIISAIPEKGYLTTGTVRYEDDYYGNWKPLNSAFTINHNGIIEDFYDKSHLVPFGEYIPLRHLIPTQIRPIANTITDFKAGTGAKNISVPNIPPFGILICYEIIFPHQIINPQDKPSWLINLTNDGWYGISSGPYQHLVSTQLRAIEEGITIVRSANSGISALINRYGKILQHLDLNQEAFLDISLPQELEIPTIYNYMGNYLPLGLCLLSLFLAFLINKKNFKQENKLQTK